MIRRQILEHSPIRVIPCVCILAAASVAAADHIHMTVDTFTDATSPRALIDAGYLGAEAAYDIDPSGRLAHDGGIAVFRLTDEVSVPGPIQGWRAGLAITFTSDFYFSTGRLDGGDFRFEITDVTPVSGPAARAVFGEFELASPVVIADSNGADRPARSFPVGAGSHPHGQFQAVSALGLYDLTIVAWDANGLYADSDPVTFRVNTCLADFDHSGGVDVFDLLAYLSEWFAAGHEADLDESGGVDVFDLLAFLDVWFGGC